MPIIYLCCPADLVYLVFGLVSGHDAPFSDLAYLVFGLVSGHDVPSSDLAYLVFGLVSGHGAPFSDPAYLVFGLVSGHGGPSSDLAYLVYGLVSGHGAPSSGLACGLASGLGHHVLNLVRRDGACLQYPNFAGLSNALYHANLSNSFETHGEVFDDDPIYALPTYGFGSYLSNEDILLHTKMEHLDK